MKHVLAPNNVFQRFILPGEIVEFSDRCKTTAKRLTPEEAAEYGVSKLQPTSAPAFDPLTESRIELDPILIDGAWVQQWNIVAITPEDQAANLLAERVAKWEAIKASREARKDGGVLVGGKWFHTDTDSRIQQLGLVQMGAAVPAVAWKTMDGTFINMSQALAGQIFQAVVELDMALFANAEAHRIAMEASANPAAYDFSTGWPEHFPI